MRATVGPLPSAVYWRRRAVVLGGVLLGIIVLFVSCSGGGGKSNQSGKNASSASASPSASGSSSAPDADPSFADPKPGSGNNFPNPSSILSQQATADDGGDDGTATTQPTLGANTNVTATTNSGTCADSEIAVTPIPAATTVKRGAAVPITLTIKNTGSRTCSRDVGSDPQELYLDAGARKYWSSDDCSSAKGSDVRQLSPGAALTYSVTWNGRQSSSCTAGAPAGPNPPPGQFDLRARLGTLVSNPVVITIVS